MASTPAVGVGTQAGLGGAVALFCTALGAFAADRTPEAISALVLATLTLVTVLWGRYRQAVAIVAAPEPATLEQTLAPAAHTATFWPADAPPVTWTGTGWVADPPPDDDEPPEAAAFRRGEYPDADDDTLALLDAEPEIGEEEL